MAECFGVASRLPLLVRRISVDVPLLVPAGRLPAPVSINVGAGKAGAVDDMLE